MNKTSSKAYEKSKLNRQTIISVVRTSSILMKLAHRFFSKYEINDGQFNILLTLRGNPQGLSQTELGRLLIVAKPNLVGMIDKLQELKYVERKVNPQDRRLNTISLTVSGEKFVSKLEPLYEEIVNKLLKNVDDSQKNFLIEQMETLRNNIETI